MRVSEEEYSVHMFREVRRIRTIQVTLYLIRSQMGKPVQFFQEKFRVVVVGCQENDSCSKVLNFLDRLDDRIRRQLQ